MVQSVCQFYKDFKSQDLTALRLQRRPEKGGALYQPKVGQKVLVSSKSKQHGWPLARVEKVFPWEDGVIWSVLVYDGSKHIVRDPRQLLNLGCDDLRNGLGMSCAKKPALWSCLTKKWTRRSAKMTLQGVVQWLLKRPQPKRRGNIDPWGKLPNGRVSWCVLLLRRGKMTCSTRPPCY